MGRCLTFFKKCNQTHKHLYTIFVIILLIAYLYIFFLPGVWYGNTFLYQRSNGTFIGSDIHHNYELQSTQTEKGMDFSFTVDGTTAQYQVIHNEENPHLQIYQNNHLVFEGHAVFDGYRYMLSDDNNNILELDTPEREDGYPTYTQLLNWSLITAYAIRGNMTLLYILITVSVLLGLSYILPKFLHSAAYQRIQKTVRLILWAAILILIPLSFIIH